MADSKIPWTTGSRVAGHASLEDIKTFSIRADLRREQQPGRQLSYEFEPVYRANLPREGVLVVDGLFRLSVTEVDPEAGEPSTPEADKEALAEVVFNVSALYLLREVSEDTGGAFGEDELDAFANSSAQFVLYPYARTVVADMVTRLGLPVLTLPTLTFDINEVSESRIAQEHVGQLTE